MSAPADTAKRAPLVTHDWFIAHRGDPVTCRDCDREWTPGQHAISERRAKRLGFAAIPCLDVEEK